MAESDNWVFDSLVGFLRGPVWNVPILTFIEHKSLGNFRAWEFLKWNDFSVFEPDEDDQNDAEYKKIHEDYKNLVGNIFVSICTTWLATDQMNGMCIYWFSLAEKPA